MGKYKYTGLFFLLVYFILSLVYYKERTLYIDPALQIFEMLNSNGFMPYVGRYSMYINQLFPMMGIWAGLPLKYILVLYSISFTLIFLFIYWLLTFRWKNVTAGLAMVATLFLTRNVFVHSISETWLTIAYSALFFGWVSYYFDRSKGWRWLIFYLVSIVLIFLNYFIHPVSLFTIGASLAWLMLYRKAWKNPHFYVLGLLVLMVYGYKFIFPFSEHEEGFFEGLKQADVLLPKFHTLPSFIYLRNNITGIYLYPLLFSGILSIYFIIYKKYLELAFLVLSFAGFTLVNCLTFYKGDSMVGMESRFLPFMFFVFIPLGKYVLETRYLNYIVFLLFFYIGSLSLYRIHRTTLKGYSSRLYYVGELIQRSKDAGVRKALLQESDVDVPRLVVGYNIAVESLLYSSIQGDSRTVFICKNKDGIAPDAMENPNSFFLVPWWVYYDENKLNARYFKLEHETYQYIGQAK